MSNLGNVRSWLNNRRVKQDKPHLLNPSIGNRGYKVFKTSRRGPMLLVHQQVCLAFHGPRPPGMVVRHLNDEPLDNRASNLAWGTLSENASDRWRFGTGRVSELRAA